MFVAWNPPFGDDVLEITGERFERRLSEEIGSLRIDMAKEFAAVRVEMATLAASMHSDTLETRAQMATLAGTTRSDILSMRAEMGSMRADILKWSFLFWVGQFAVFSAMMTFLLRTVGAR